MSGFPSNHVRLNTAVTKLTNEPDGRVRLHTGDGFSEVFDHVILATHGDQAYSIVRDSATEQERAILQNFRTAPSVAVLHSDASLMPENRKAWSSWNYLTRSSPLTGRGHVDQVCVTYDMNTVQQIPYRAFGDVFLTLNPLHEPDPSTVQGRYTYQHPRYTPGTIRAQQQLDSIQNKRGISYAGAWTGYGFHEDGFNSGVRVAVEHLGGKIPFEFKDLASVRGERPALTILHRLVRFVVLLVQLFFLAVLDRLVDRVEGLAAKSTTRRLAMRVKGPAAMKHEKKH
jgi:predicted NAD/FAD-binding protein